MPPFSSLPAEIVLHIFSQLSIPALLSVSQSSRINHTLAHSCLQTLHLSIQPSRLAALASLLSTSASPGVLPLNNSSNPAFSSPFLQEPTLPLENPTTTKPSHHLSSELISLSRGTLVHLIPRSQTFSLSGILYYQNTLASTLVSRYENVLRSLALDIWELDSRAARAIASLLRRPAQLKQLALRFDNPIVRGQGAGGPYWRRTSGSQAISISRFGPPEEKQARATWGLICDACTDNGEGSLESLELVRAGIEGSQVAALVKSHPRLRELHLKKCGGVGFEFWEAMRTAAQACNGLALEVLWFTDSLHPETDDQVLHVVGALHNLRSLSLYGCHNIDSRLIDETNKKIWQIPDLVLPRPINQADSEPIEVDPSYQ